MSSALIASPSMIAGQMMVDRRLAHWIDGQQIVDEWPLFVGSLPHGEDSPKDALALFGPDGTIDGRTMDGEVQRHPGLQLRVRSREYPPGYATANNIYRIFTEDTYWRPVVVDGVTYRIQNISGRSDILELGIDKDTDLHGFAANFIVTIESQGIQ